MHLPRLVIRQTWFLTVLILGIAAPIRAASSEFIWIEGEQPAACNIKPSIAGWGHKEFLSEEKWLHISIDADKVEKEAPADGVVIEYAFKTSAEAAYEIWNRIGFEFARSSFEWRIDAGAWVMVRPDQLTTDLMELDFWCEVAWLKLGQLRLGTGDHKLQIRLPRTKDDKGKTARLLYASDAICIYPGQFMPNSRFKPNENHRSARDLEAERNVFQVPQPSRADARIAVALKGLWEICRHDEQLPGNTAEPITQTPSKAYWTAIEVPGDKNILRPDLLFAHRLWYRTRVHVPEACAGRSFHLTFPQNNLNTTVFVNGVFCGFSNTPFAPCQIDVTKGIKPGVNEIWVGIRDAWYGFSTNPKDPMKLRRKFNLPLSYSHGGFNDLAYPIWNHFQSGILVTPEFVVAGSVKADDVFCKPSVSRKQLAVEVTLRNTTDKDVNGQVVCQAINAKTNAVEKMLPAKPFTLSRGAEQVIELADKWDNPQLWWPDDPRLYVLRTTVHLDGQAVDTVETTFGFREWTIDGKDFKLNGIVWHGWADCFTARSPEEWLTFYRKSNQTMMRFWGTKWQDMPPREALSFFDRNGVIVRRSGILDGEAIGYNAVEHDPDLKKESEVKMDLMRNWKEQMVAQVKAERNHPSIMIWSIENEWLYINCINLHGGLMDQFEAEVLKVSDAVRAADPTRPTMTDGGGANKDNSMPVHGNHYVFGDYPRYPALAYEANVEGGGRGRWRWDQKRPRFIGEDFFANGINPFDYSYFGGEETFQGKAQSRRAAGIIYRMLTEGYRWAGYGAWHLWMGQHEAVDQYGSNSPIAVFCRQWDWTFGSRQKVMRTLRIFNDTRFDDPITFAWNLEVNGQKLASGTKDCRVNPGGYHELELAFELPEVDARGEGELVLSLSIKGKEVFRDTKAVSIINASARQPSVKPGDLLVYDPAGTVVDHLKTRAVPFTALDNLGSIPEAGRVLIIGKNALNVAESSSSRLQAYAASGRSVIILEQKNPLKYQGLPAEMEAASNEGRTSFCEDLDHPAFRNLRQKDFFTWGEDQVVYRNAYVKPTRGGKSLVQCHDRLAHTALTELPVGQGLLLVSQLTIGERLPGHAVSQQLLANLIDYAASYRLEHRQVTLCTNDNPQLARTLDAIGLKYNPVPDPMQAIASTGQGIAIIPASATNLKALADNLNKVRQFTQAGGWIVLNHLTPDGLADYNRIVGFDHMIRPFRMERVTFPAVRNPLTAGLTTADVVMQSGKRINTFTSDVFLASDVFSYVVDLDEVAPFAKFPDPKYFAYDDSGNDHNPLNMVNGFVSADGWQYIFSIPLHKGAPHQFTLTFPQEQEIVEMEWTGNAFYNLVTKIELTFDGKKDDIVTLKTQPNNETQSFQISPPRKVRELTINLAEWEKASQTDVIGVDNIRLKVKRSPEFYKAVKPMLNIGAMMQYSQGSGGVVLCNILFQESESVPENLAKKRTILATILRNLKAPFAEGRSIIAGTNLAYEPIDISKVCNQYRDERGWFGDRNFTFKDMPTGRQVFAGVPFMIYEFPTSPVPTVIMLDGGGIPNKLAKEVRGIPVNRKADALFFLHTARMDARMNAHEVREKKRYEMARYVVTYADGQAMDIPIYAESDIDDYRQEQPRAIAGAQIAWMRPYEGRNLFAVAYSKQWNNPRPDVEIKSVDMVYGQQPRGVPALIAITAASAK